MKVLHLWRSESASMGGGGAGSMFRIHSNLRMAGIDSKILCEIKTSTSPHVTVIQTWPRLERKIKQVTSKLGLNDIHRVSSFRIKQHKSYLEADILNFHGIHSEFINYLALPFLTKNKPAVFTLRDMWCLTGHCAVTLDCIRWKIGCGNCPYLDTYPPVRRDSTRIEWKLKNWSYRHSNLTIVALSEWLAEQAKQSMLNRFPIYHIPNGVNTDSFKPLDPDRCRYNLGIPRRKKVLFFASTHVNNLGKGGDILLEVLQKLPKSLKDDIILLIMGKNSDTLTKALDIQSVKLGYVSNDLLKASAYSAADLYVSPTRGESFGQTILESLACGTPVVSFNLGPIPELVRPEITGYLAEPEKPNDFAKGIVQLLEDKPLLNRMGELGRSIAVKEYSSDLEVQRYIQLYQQLLKK